ncbi:thiamine pyrophosphate-binding protein [Fodinicurvata sp. EGI_FJ10296]|uniref:thiamine pyrophosphate-binding protein n=1 Tax=Fodinicurvata sp. EGI_FJ10296 TaxID=3231908 RepID=UPI00345598F6
MTSKSNDRRPAPISRTGARHLVDTLIRNGVDTVFCVPGESYLSVLDALHDVGDAIRLVVCRQEGGAAVMAEAYAKLTGRPGIVFVTRGPGVTNASIGLHTAQQDSTPVILFMGQVGTGEFEREAFQELDVRRVFPSMTKWAAQIDRADRVVEMVGHAFSTAMNGRPGPVVLALPEDMLIDEAECRPAAPARKADAAPSAADLAELRDRLAEADKPFLIVGGGGWSPAARDAVCRFAEAWSLPVGTSFRCQDYIDNDHACYAGDVGIGANPALVDRVKEADLLIVLGPRLGEMTTGGYTVVEAPLPRQSIVHIHADPEELGRVYHTALPIAASPLAAAEALAALPPPAGDPAWSGDAATMHQSYLSWQDEQPMVGDVNLSAVVRHLSETEGPDAIFANGAGNFAAWLHRFYRYRGYRTQLAPTSGAMGYGLPAAVAAAIVDPSRRVTCWAGDGDIMMTIQELATAVQYGASLTVIIVNNGMFGTIRMHQEREYPTRVSGTALVNPDFVALARSFGARAERVTRTDMFADALARVRDGDGVGLIELVTDQETISPRATISGLRAAAK